MRGDWIGSWTGWSASCRWPMKPRKEGSLWKSSASPPSAIAYVPRTRSSPGGVVHPDLEALLTLQAKDQDVTQSEQALAALEPDVGRLDEQLAVAQRSLDAARRAIDEALRRKAELEGKIANYKTMQDQRRQKLEWVRGAKEASTLMAELDLARSVLAKEEAEFMRSGDAVTEAERRAAEAEKALDEARAAQAPLREALAGKRDQIAAQRERAVAERDRAATQVASGLLGRYERIRRGKAPLALYALHGDACGHCFTAVPTQRRSLIQRGAARPRADPGARCRSPHPRAAGRHPRAAWPRRAGARQGVSAPRPGAIVGPAGLGRHAARRQLDRGRRARSHADSRAWRLRRGRPVCRRPAHACAPERRGRGPRLCAAPPQGRIRFRPRRARPRAARRGQTHHHLRLWHHGQRSRGRRAGGGYRRDRHRPPPSARRAPARLGGARSPTRRLRLARQRPVWHRRGLQARPGTRAGARGVAQPAVSFPRFGGARDRGGRRAPHGREPHLGAPRAQDARRFPLDRRTRPGRRGGPRGQAGQVGARRLHPRPAPERRRPDRRCEPGLEALALGRSGRGGRDRPELETLNTRRQALD